METLVIIACLLLSAFFSGMEIAYVSSNKVYLEVEKKQSSLISTILTRLTENPQQFITSMLVGNTIVLVVYAYYLGDAVLRWLPGLGEFHVVSQILVQVAITAFILLLTAEFIPKIFFQVYANSLIKIFALPAYVFYRAFYQVSRFITVLADFFLVKILLTKGYDRQEFFSRGELGHYITEQLKSTAQQEEVDTEIQIFQNALEFGGLKARDIMTPRTEIAAVGLHDSITSLRELFIETDYSKMVVYQDTMDNVVGYIHSFELFRKPESIRAIMIPIEYAPETIYIKELLSILTRKRRSMAVILDEYGGTSGLVTIEDIIEELFGEIDDEHDEEQETVEEVLEDGTYLFSARLDVEYVNEKYGLNIPEADAYATLGGFIMDHTKEIPRTGDKLVCKGFSISVTKASGNKIEVIIIEPLQDK